MYPVAASLFGIAFVIFAAWTTYLLVRVQELKEKLYQFSSLSRDALSQKQAAEGKSGELGVALSLCQDRLKQKSEEGEWLGRQLQVHAKGLNTMRRRLRARVASQRKNYEFEDATRE